MQYNQRPIRTIPAQTPWLFGILLLLPVYGIAQCTLICNQSLQVSVDNLGEAAITPDMIAPTAGTYCPGNLELTLTLPSGFPAPNPLTCAEVGKTIIAKITHTASGNNCSTSLQVRDLQPPDLDCPERFVSCSQDPSPYGIDFPVWMDNCTPVNGCTFTYSDVVTDMPCSATQNGVRVMRRIDRSWIVKDARANASTCMERIWVRRADLSQVTFPAHLDGMALPVLACGQDPYDLELTGQPTIDESPIDGNGECELASGYLDQRVNICGTASYTVLRAWRIIDLCSNTVASALQIIRVEDHVPPVLTVPANITIGTNSQACAAAVTLPAATATDNCSAVSVSAAWSFGNGFGPFPSVATGVYTVTYTATDVCGNKASKTMRVTVVDASPPSVVCTGSLQLSLTNDGTAVLPAATLDAGSADNCGPVSFSAARDGFNYAPEVAFNCADVGKTLPVTLRVMDAVGLENFCAMQVTVRDLLRPNLLCPTNRNLNCLQNPTDLGLTGMASASDNCALQSLTHTDLRQTDACNLGSLMRTWVATDSSGNSRSCIQTINLQPVNTTAVAFPANKTVNICAGASDLTPAVTGRPVVTGESCSSLSITFSDEQFPQAPPPSCFRIVRTWKVIDFCVYNPNLGTSGYWEAPQLIDVRDQSAPTLTIPPDVTLTADRPGCLAELLLSPATAEDCSPLAQVTHNSPHASAAGNNASGLYPVGTHTIIYIGVDACGNTASASQQVLVLDVTAPVARCRNDILLYLAADSTASLPAARVNNASTDDCSPGDSLRFAVLPANFNCGQLGEQQVTLTVTDGSGNVAACFSRVQVFDTLNVCNPLQPIRVDGAIHTPAGKPVYNIPVQIFGAGVNETINSDSLGTYLFPDVLAGDSCRLTPSHNDNWLNGISTLDLALITKHILGLDTFTSPYQHIAADANHSGTITTFDIVQLRKLILGILDTVPDNTSWRFVPADYSFPNPANPFETAFPESILLDRPLNDVSGQDFIGIKVGDVNGSVNPMESRNATKADQRRNPTRLHEDSKVETFPKGGYLPPPYH